MRIRTLHAWGLTNLSKEEVARYDKTAPDSSHAGVTVGRSVLLYLAVGILSLTILIITTTLELRSYEFGSMSVLRSRNEDPIKALARQYETLLMALSRYRHDYAELASRLEAMVRDTERDRERLALGLEAIAGALNARTRDGELIESIIPIIVDANELGTGLVPFTPLSEQGSFRAELPRADDPSIETLHADQVVTATISEKIPVEWYKIHVSGPSVVELDVTAQNSDLDSLMALFSSDTPPKQITMNDDHDGCDSLIRTVLYPGQYVVGVGGYSESTGDYELCLRIMPISMREELPFSTTGRIRPTNREEWYRFTVAKDGLVVVEVNSITDGDTDLSATVLLVSPDYGVVKESLMPKWQPDSRIYALTGGDYLLVVTSARIEETCEYSLSIRMLRWQ